MTWGRSVLLTIPLVLSGIFVVASPASADTQIGNGTDWTSISTGGSHTCGIRSGELWCWGNNDNGQVGNGGDNRQDVPDQIGSSSQWTVVSAGAAHTCGIRSSKLYCWGSDSDGQLGNGSSGSRDTPGLVSNATWKTVSAGASHTCAIRSDLILACWGSDENGQIGNPGANGQSPSVPTLVSAAHWKTVSAGGSHTCGIRTDGMIACWGSDTHGQIGNGSLGSPSVPAKISNALDWKTVSAGGEHTCATRGSGLLACWGNDERGQIGNGGGGSPTAPIKITNATDWKVVSAGGSNTCAIRGAGALYCWGDNSFGETTGSASTTPRTSPVRLYSSVADFKTTDAGYQLSCGIRTNGKLYCWGGMTPTPSCSAQPYTQPDGIDFNFWKLTTPVDLDNNGTADEIKRPQLNDSFAAPPYFTISGASRTFNAPVTGATTSGSTYPRSELREMNEYTSSYTNAAWARSSGTHVMRIHQEITHLPETTPNVVAGQIHDGHNDMLQIRLEDTKLLATFNDGSSSQVLDTSYVVGSDGPMDLQIQADSCGMTVTYNASRKATVPVTNDNGNWYFKAGVYTQANESNGTGYGEVRIDGLAIVHE